MPLTPRDRVMTPKQAAEFIGMSVSSVYRLIADTPDFPAFRIRSNLYIRESKLLEWIAAQEAKGH